MSETVPPSLRWAHAARQFVSIEFSLHTTFSVIAPGPSPEETKMWAAVRENGDFLTVLNYTIFINVVNYTIFAATCHNRFIHV